MTLLRGVQMGFGECLGPDPFNLVESWNADLVRIGVEPEKDSADAILAEVVGRSFTPLVCVHLALDIGPVIAAAQAQQLASFYVECGNEPMINGMEDPRKYVAYLQRQISQADDLGFPRDRLCVGSILNCDTETLRWLEYLCWRLDAIDPAHELLVSYHRYARIINGRQVMHRAHQWHRTRTEEFESLRCAAHHRALGASEFGFDVGTREWNGHAIRMTDARQEQACRAEVSWMATHGVRFACWYQVNCGSTDSFIDNYGLRAFDGTVKQPLVESLFGEV